jgi:N-acetylglucosaminyl-diphospho-decaprenol L-rhamnosyltransferase
VPESPLRCAVVVVNYNGAEFVGECLESLRIQQVNGLDVQVLVVDNQSSDGSAELIAERFPDFTLVRSDRNRGFAGGVNLALAATSAEVVVLLNPDAAADPGFLDAITAPLRAAGSEHLAAVSGRIQLSGRFRPAPGDPNAYRSASGERWTRLPSDAPDTSGVVLLNSTGSQLSRSGNARDRSWLTPADSPTLEANVFGFCGGAAALRRSALDAVGSFDESLFMYYEDVDLSWRLRRAGWQIRYAADATVTHRHAASSGIRSRLFLVHNIRNRILVTARNGPPAMVRAALLRTVVSLGKSLVRCLAPGQSADARRQVGATVTAVVGAARAWPATRASGRRQDARSDLPRTFVDDWTLPD